MQIKALMFVQHLEVLQWEIPSMCKILSFVCDKFIISLIVFHSYYEKHNHLEIFLLAT